MKYLALIFFTITFSLNNYAQVRKLSKVDKEIMGGLYFGMTKDSAEKMLIANFKYSKICFTDCWLTPISNSSYWYLTNKFDFEKGKSTKTISGHYGILVPIYRSSRLTELYVVLGNYQIDGIIYFRQAVSNTLIKEILNELGNKYGEPIERDKLTSTYLVYSNSDFNKLSNPDIFISYNTPFGKTELSIANIDASINWNSYVRGYFCMFEPDYEIKLENSVSKYPCLHYVLDSKYYSQLKIK